MIKIKIKQQKLHLLIFIVILLLLLPIIYYPNMLWIQGYKGFQTWRSFNSITNDELIITKKLSELGDQNFTILSDPYTSKIITVLTGLKTSKYDLNESRLTGLLYNDYLSQLTYNFLNKNSTSIINYLNSNNNVYLIVSSRTIEWFSKSKNLIEKNNLSWTQLEIQNVKQSLEENPYPSWPLFFSSSSVMIYHFSGLTNIQITDYPIKSIINYSNLFDYFNYTINPFLIMGEIYENKNVPWIGFDIIFNDYIDISKLNYLKLYFKTTNSSIVQWFRIVYFNNEEHTFINIRKITQKEDVLELLINLDEINVPESFSINKINKIEILIRNDGTINPGTEISILKIQFLKWK
jgi:hypothetical protein